MTKNKSQKNIPDGWQEIKLGEISSVFDGTHQTPNYTKSGIPFYSVEHLTANDFTDTKYVSEEVFERESKRVKIEKGDILMTRIGDVGTARHINWDVKASFYVSLALIKCKKDVNAKFLTFFINSAYFQREVWGKTIHVAFPNKINLGDISKCVSILPPLPEQKRIVALLEVWDEVVEKLGRKIEVKKNIKKGLMQELLSGKKRLSGFKEGWRDIKISKLGKNYSGITGKNKDDFGSGKPFISYMNIYSNSKLDTDFKSFVDIKNGEKQNAAKYGDLFFTTSSETPHEVGISSVLLDKNVGELYLNSFCFGFRLNNFKILIPEFSQFYFRGQYFRKQMTRIAQGASRFNLSKKYFLETKINIPKDIKEQKAIADILVTADWEIEKLEEKLRIIKDQKKYLLNNLITGAIRTPENLLIN